MYRNYVVFFFGRPSDTYSVSHYLKHEHKFPITQTKIDRDLLKSKGIEVGCNRGVVSVVEYKDRIEHAIYNGNCDTKETPGWNPAHIVLEPDRNDPDYKTFIDMWDGLNWDLPANPFPV